MRLGCVGAVAVAVSMGGRVTPGGMAKSGHLLSCRSWVAAGLSRYLVADSGPVLRLVVMPSRSRWSPQRYCSAEMVLAMAAAAAVIRGSWPAGAAANAWCRAAIRSSVVGEPGWFRSEISRATELNT